MPKYICFAGTGTDAGSRKYLQTRVRSVWECSLSALPTAALTWPMWEARPGGETDNHHPSSTISLTSTVPQIDRHQRHPAANAAAGLYLTTS